jgi:hypothetical protein
MNNKEKYPIVEEWEDYYEYLESVRRAGFCNMWEASVYLQDEFPYLTKKLAGEILVNWITNYDALNEKYDWSNRQYL